MKPEWVVAAVAAAGVVFNAGIAYTTMLFIRTEVRRLQALVDDLILERSKLEKRVDQHEWRITNHDERIHNHDVTLDRIRVGAQP